MFDWAWATAGKFLVAGQRALTHPAAEKTWVRFSSTVANVLTIIDSMKLYTKSAGFQPGNDITLQELITKTPQVDVLLMNVTHTVEPFGVLFTGDATVYSKDLTAAGKMEITVKEFSGVMPPEEIVAMSLTLISGRVHTAEFSLASGERRKVAVAKDR